MIYKAYNLDTERLLSLPETGMGYQFIEAKRFGKSFKEKFVVYNAQVILDLDDKFTTNKKFVFEKGLTDIINLSEGFPVETDSIQLLSKSQVIESRILSTYKFENRRRHKGGKGAKDSDKEKASGYEIFVRLSAYEDDKRIDFVNRKLKDGSYTTTLQDYNDCVITQDDPVDRYALPNDEEIEWAFYIKPDYGDVLQRGNVQPAFGHDGGGIEAYFEYGTSNKTYFDKRAYGK